MGDALLPSLLPTLTFFCLVVAMTLLPLTRH